MTVKEMISEIEHLYGRQPQMYIKRLINDALLDMSGKIQHYSAIATQTLKQNKRWYPLSDTMIEIKRVEVKNSDGNYELVPMLDNYNELKEGDTV